MQVEIVTNVFFVDFYKKLVAFKVAEPTDPSSSGLRVIVIIEVVFCLSSYIAMLKIEKTSFKRKGFFAPSFLKHKIFEA